ncbi:scavenger receptor cysteine-rich type 1 protein M130-like [Brachyistius frenatus]|uniref:scavenger receptor cysteine-rich type 1 protein M130-like n=1 Tax=Brachyistius frenatus TaxID=100188 RepID=UPI0037E79442
MDRALATFLLLWSAAGLRTEGNDAFEAVDDIRLVGGASNCSGRLHVKRGGVWSEVDDEGWNLKLADVVCGRLDCGTAVQTSSEWPDSSPESMKWSCLRSQSRLRKCLTKRSMLINTSLKIICSGSVRLVGGTSLCSGRLEVKSNQSWSSVCEDAFDLQDAAVVCRELGCGAPSVLRGAPYEEVAPPMWSDRFHCEGSESSLLDCRISSADTCSPGKSAQLTCSDPDEVRLVGGTSRCVGRLEIKGGEEWRPVEQDFRDPSFWDLTSAAVVCKKLDCGTAISTSVRKRWFDGSRNAGSWRIWSSCGRSDSTVRECASLLLSDFSNKCLEVTCSESVRLVGGTSLCSGRLEVKSDQSWSSVCEDAFDLQDAAVVCRELGCGAPSAFVGRLYGEAEPPARSEALQCEGGESVLSDCKRSGSSNTCSPGQAVGLTCSEPDRVRLFGGTSRCDGTLEMEQHGKWRLLISYVNNWEQKVAALVCQQLDCGSVVSANIKPISLSKPARIIRDVCIQPDSVLRECLALFEPHDSNSRLEVICSDLLARPNISFSQDAGGVSEVEQRGLLQVLLGSSFTIGCSIAPQYPGGSFQLHLSASAASRSYSLPAVNHTVNHTARFLFSAADHAHRGTYSCVYHVYVFSHNFSSTSPPLHLAVSASSTDLIIRVVVVVLLFVLFIAALFCCCKATRGQKTSTQEENIELDDLCGAERREEEEAGAPGTE